MASGRFRILVLFFAALLAAYCAASAESGEDLFSWLPLEDGSAVITGWKGAGTDLAFPETLDGHTVTRLSKSFSFNTPSVKNLRSVTIPDTMTVIEPGAFQFAEYLADIRIAGNHPVFSFADGVLYNREKQSITLYLQSNKAESFSVPAGIREIEDKAFIRAKLVSLMLPVSMERIGAESFNQCVTLEDILLPEGLKSIGTDAFTNCDRLKRIMIPAGVTAIGEAAFTDNHLEEIRVDPGNTVFTVSDGALINTRDGVLLAYPAGSAAESCTIPDGVRRIGRFAFYRSHHLKQVTFPDGLLEIAHGAFISCNHLSVIDLPDTVAVLEYEAFEGNSDAERLHIPAALAEITGNFNGAGIARLEIPETVTAVAGSFCSLPNLTEVVIPGSVKTLSGNSFAFCKNLSAVTIQSGTSEIGCSFIGCSASLAVRVEPDSYAERYCMDRQLNWEYITD